MYNSYTAFIATLRLKSWVDNTGHAFAQGVGLRCTITDVWTSSLQSGLVE